MKNDFFFTNYQCVMYKNCSLKKKKMQNNIFNDIV
jgi:hypothetical protein